ncbi:MAG: IS21-like element helper ATPase IstB [Cryomorphaceae bacterium]|nr:IS21-like element helper ATPase IstB [Cryomorphaceae bacterium]
MNDIESRLTSLRLHGMHRAWESLKQSRQLQNLEAAEVLDLLLQSEQDERQDRRYKRLYRNAKFRYNANLEEVKIGASRGLEKSLVARLTTGNYLEKGESILITGATGCGKSFFASSLGNQACIQGHSVAYYNAQKLMLRAKLSRAEGTSIKFFEKISKTELLIIDDFGLTSLDAIQRMDLMEIIEDRHARKSTIISSQLPVASWYNVIGEDTIADAILDRLVNTSHHIEIKGESMRKKM